MHAASRASAGTNWQNLQLFRNETLSSILVCQRKKYWLHAAIKNAKKNPENERN